MGVPGAGGAGPSGARRPSHVAYYVALVGILSLLIMLCLYFFYYFIKKVKELSSSDSVCQPTTSCRPPAATSAYPVAPVVRDSASAMARLCKQVPGAAGKGDTVFPAASSPAALRASTGEPDPRPAPASAPDPRPAPPAPRSRPASRGPTRRRRRPRCPRRPRWRRSSRPRCVGHCLPHEHMFCIALLVYVTLRRLVPCSSCTFLCT